MTEAGQPDRDLVDTLSLTRRVEQLERQNAELRRDLRRHERALGATGDGRQQAWGYVRALIDASPDSALLLQPDGTIVAANETLARRYGQESPADLVGTSAWDIVQPEVHARRRAMLAEVVTSGEARAFRDAWGGRTYEHSMQPVLDAAGTVSAVAVFARDVTEQERGRRQFVERERQLRLLADSVPASLAYVDRDGVYHYANARYEERLGRPIDRIVGRTVREVLGDDLHATLAPHIAAALAGRVVEYTQRFPFADGSERWLEVRYVPDVQEDDEVAGFYALSIDVDARERAIATSKRLLAAIEQSMDSVVITDPEGDIQYVNAAFSRITGYDAEEVRGENPRILKSGKQDAAFYEAMWRTLTGGEAWSGRLVNRRKDGRLFTEASTITPVRDAAGRLVNYVAVKRDITHELALEQEVQQAQKMEAIGALAGGVAHDFNNVLYAIMGNIELALGKLSGDDEVAACLRESLAASQRARDLVRRILAFSRRREHAREVIDPVAAARDAMKLLSATLPATVEIVDAVEDDCPAVEADPTELHQILMNLCSNAQQAMPGGKGRLTVAVRPEPSPAGGAGRVEAVWLEVRDDGVGMPPEVRRRCLEPYFTTKDVGQGTGMGLALVHGLVTGLGGRLDIDSAPGRGTAVAIRLPAVGRERIAARPAPRRTMTPAPRPGRIMIVEDEPAILDLVTTVLARAGYRPRGFGDPREALACFREAPAAWDLVLTDQTMPALTGADLTRELLALRPDLPIVICSGYSATLSEDDAHAIGVREYLQKPLEVDALTAVLARVLGPAGS